MTVTLVREDDKTSRHPRYRIPATVEIDEWRYPVQQWSVEGFSAAGVHDAGSLGGVVPARMIFRFDGFTTVVDVNAEVLSHDPASDTILCRFTDLSGQKVAVLRAVIDSYLMGEFVSVDDLIHVVKHDPSETLEPDNALARTEIAPRRAAAVRRWLGLTLACLLLVALLGLSLSVGYRRLYVVEAASAVVTAPIVLVRAPLPSYFRPVLGPDAGEVDKGQPLANMELVGGGSTVIESPCGCRVIERHALGGQFVSTGEPLLTLLPKGERPFVSAKVDVDDAKLLSLGDRAAIALPDGSTLKGTVRRVLYGEPLVRALSAPLARAPADVISYHDVIVEPDGALPLALLGVPATVEISTFGGRQRKRPDPAPDGGG